jgi:cobalt-precorrin-5B (C1)-methyltransferase
MNGLRRGFTTGTAAAAAAKAASVGLLKGVVPDRVDVTLPGGESIGIEIHFPAGSRGQEAGDAPHAVASVIKDAGDDPDVTDGLEIVAKVRTVDGGDVFIRGGRGVGVVTRPGLQIPVGESAINPVPRYMIERAVREVIPDGGVEVEIMVPEGEEVAMKTFNPRLGIQGGISIIGTTGIVEPKSLDALKATISCEIDVALAEAEGRNRKPPLCVRTRTGREVRGRGTEHETRNPELFFAPGKIGEDALKGIFGDVRVIMMSNFVGYALGYAREKGVFDVVIGGHPGKLAKILMGYLDTHSRNSPQATGFVARFLGLDGKFNTVEEIVQRTKSTPCKGRNFSDLAAEIADSLQGRYGFRSVTVCLFDMKKELVGEGVSL